ncbi:unnamed protein product [Rhizopus stolonifer]
MYNISKKTWKVTGGLLLIISLLFLYQRPHQYYIESTKTENTNIESVELTDNTNNAFVTFLCDDVMGEATQVLVYSLTQTQTQHDIVVLVLDEVTLITRKKLEHLGAKIVQVDQIKYPWQSSSARRKGFNKACRYSKLNLWNLTQYKKVVFLDADTMVVKSIDDLFDYPQFSAVVDIGGVLNTGVFVAEPNKETYEDIMKTYENAPSYNKGDQGFLNFYFNQTVNFLPGYYNLMIKFTHFSTLASSFVTTNTVRVLHFTSETKPWNFHFLNQREWRENYDGYLFGLWTRALRNMRTSLETVGLWSGPKRAQAICDTRLKKNYGRRYPKTNQFTVIIYSEPHTTQDQLMPLLEMYAASKKVARIFVHKDKRNKALKAPQLKKPIKMVVDNKYSTANTRFNPIQGITTEAVFITDLSASLDLQDLEFGFSVWKKNKDSAVGYSSDRESEGYSMIDSNAMFVHSDFLYGYTCLLPEQIHHVVDLDPSCQSVAINMLISGMTGSSPLQLNVPSFKTSHTVEKSKCVKELTVFFNNKNPLVFNNQVISRLPVI